MAVAERLTTELNGSQSGKTEVRNTRVEFREDSSGDEAVYIILTLANPTAGQQTWPIDDLWALRREVREIKTEAEKDAKDIIDFPWFIVFEPEKPSELEDEGLQEIVTVDDE
jgi:hypothetical protein